MNELELPPPADRTEFLRRITADRRQQRREALDRRLQLYGRRLSDVGNFCYSGVVKVVQFPAYALDLLDRCGKPDHSKMGPFLVSQELLVICAWDVVVNKHALQAAIVMIIAVLSFASASLMRLFVQRTETKLSAFSETKAETLDVTVREIQERRDPDKGFEASP